MKRCMLGVQMSRAVEVSNPYLNTPKQVWVRPRPPGEGGGGECVCVCVCALLQRCSCELSSKSSLIS